MSFPTIPTVASGDLLSSTTSTASTTHTFPSLSSLRGGAGPQAGDLLIAICVQYQGGTANAEFGSWGASFTEFLDDALGSGTGEGANGFAYKIATGSESGTFTVTSAHSFKSVQILMRIPAATWHGTTPPEVTASNRGAGVAGDPASLSPSWGADDTLWIYAMGHTETSTTGSPPTISASPTNYSGDLIVARGADAVGEITAGVGFRQLNAASENAGAYTGTNLNRGNGIAALIAVRPVPPPVEWFIASDFPLGLTIDTNLTVSTPGGGSLVPTTPILSSAGRKAQIAYHGASDGANVLSGELILTKESCRKGDLIIAQIHNLNGSGFYDIECINIETLDGYPSHISNVAGGPFDVGTGGAGGAQMIAMGRVMQDGGVLTRWHSNSGTDDMAGRLYHFSGQHPGLENALLENRQGAPMNQTATNGSPFGIPAVQTNGRGRYGLAFVAVNAGTTFTDVEGELHYEWIKLAEYQSWPDSFSGGVQSTIALYAVPDMDDGYVNGGTIGIGGSWPYCCDSIALVPADEEKLLVAVGDLLPVTVVTDDFNRADNTSMGPNWQALAQMGLSLGNGLSYGGMTVPGFQILSNAAAPESSTADVGEYYVGLGRSWPSPNQYAQAKVTVSGTNGAGSGVGVMVRCSQGGDVTTDLSAEGRQGVTSFYRAVVDKAASNNLEISKYVNGVYTNLGRTTVSWTDGWILRIVAVGNRITAWYGATSSSLAVALFVFDSDVDDGLPGIYVSTTITSGSVDDFEAGVVGADPIVNDKNDSTFLTLAA